MTTFRALTTGVTVDVQNDGPALAHALIESYPPADSSELHYVVGGTEVRRDGVPLRLDDPRDLVPLFEMDLYEQVIARAQPGWLLHAAALSIDGKALVLCGPSGAGKTTLTLALVARGHRLLTEEVVWIDAAGVVRGLARPIHVPHDSPQRTRIPTRWKQLPYSIRARDGSLREDVLVIPEREALELGPLPLHAIVRIGHGPDWPVHLDESPLARALQRLWDRSLRQDDAGLAVATDVLREHGSFELSSRTEADALRLLAPLLK